MRNPHTPSRHRCPRSGSTPCGHLGRTEAPRTTTDASEAVRPRPPASRHHVFEGVLLRDVVASAGPGFDARRRKDRSRFLLTVSGGDGHHTVLARAELDADSGDSPVLLATRPDGADLDECGAQLVVPSDRCGARYVGAVTHVWFGAPAAPGI
ncbi:molybdopterin-dependent oxidoreductase [Streptomyces sp. NPDC090036]|uniref:molybdopterin-dependent oxidoreductase n=1 Tax=Streptomyces sp. NPDC090036 TaxID=3365926 RepID=UPI0037F353CF